MPDAPDFLSVLSSLNDAFSRAGAKWYLFGAQAVVVYGRPRATADIDVTIYLADGEIEPLLEELRRGGFSPRASDLAEFTARTRVVPLAHVQTGTPVDIVLAGAGVELEFLANVRLIRFGGLELPVISPEDLLVTKILAGRPKDLEDARGVLAEQSGRLDLARTRNWLQLFEQALDRSDLVAELDRLQLSRSPPPRPSP